MVVPVNKKVRIITTANDVIHAFMVPAFGIKQDAIPGFVRDTWFRAEKTGDFYGQCAELCGKEHAYMPIHVKVLSAQDYAQWVEGEKKKAGSQAGRPAKVWTLDDWSSVARRCMPPTARPATRPAARAPGPIKPLDGSAIVLDADTPSRCRCCSRGQNNGAMPAWKQLSDTDIAAVITYTKNNWSNKTGQLVQPPKSWPSAQVITAQPH
jgi:cytochrome c oxidase subunit 2